MTNIVLILVNSVPNGKKTISPTFLLGRAELNYITMQLECVLDSTRLCRDAGVVRNSE